MLYSYHYIGKKKGIDEELRKVLEDVTGEIQKVLAHVR
jgi:hypothetical protein